MNYNYERNTDSNSVADVVKIYTKEASLYPLLSEADEEMYFNRYALSLDAKEMLEDSSLTEDDRNALLSTVELGERAKEMIFNCNQRLVISIARGFTGRGLDFLDLVQEGNMGLLKAIDKFDVTLGNKFSTYATYWIKQAIGRSITEQSQTIRIPSYVNEHIIRLSRAINRLTIEFGRNPSEEELAEATNLTVDKVIEYCSYMNKVGSLDEVINEDVTRADMVADTKNLNPLEVLAEESKKDLLMSLLRELSEKEQQIIIMHYGLNDTPKMTLEAIGELFDITRERVRQIEANAFKTLRKRVSSIDPADLF